MATTRRMPGRTAQSLDRDDEVAGHVRVAAVRLFNERGYGSANIDDIASEAGVGVGSVYRRWPDKPALANDVFGRTVEALTELVALPVAGRAARSRFLSSWRVLWDFAHEHPAEFMFVEGHTHEAFVSDANRARKGRLGDLAASRLLEAGVAAPPGLAVSMILGTIVYAMRAEIDVDASDAAVRMWRALR